MRVDDDDESDVVLVVVAGVPQRGGEPAHRYRGVRQRGVRLGAPRGVTDRVDLIHRLGAERVEFRLCIGCCISQTCAKFIECDAAAA